MPLRTYNNGIYKISELMSLIKTDTEFSKIIARGAFELFDYDAGIYSVYGKICHNDGKYSIHLSISTTDDGSWDASSQPESEGKCKERFRKLTDIIDKMSIIPAEKELNQILQSVGMYGTYTG